MYLSRPALDSLHPVPFPFWPSPLITGLAAAGSQSRARPEGQQDCRRGRWKERQGCQDSAECRGLRCGGQVAPAGFETGLGSGVTQTPLWCCPPAQLIAGGTQGFWDGQSHRGHTARGLLCRDDPWGSTRYSQTLRSTWKLHFPLELLLSAPLGSSVGKPDPHRVLGQRGRSSQLPTGH